MLLCLFNSVLFSLYIFSCSVFVKDCVILIDVGQLWMMGDRQRTGPAVVTTALEMQKRVVAAGSVAE